MDRTRIRWRNVGRLAGGLGAGALVLIVVPGLLEPGDPRPLPADVGLDPGAAGDYAYVPATRGRRERPSPQRHPAPRGGVSHPQPTPPPRRHRDHHERQTRGR